MERHSLDTSSTPGPSMPPRNARSRSKSLVSLPSDSYSQSSQTNLEHCSLPVLPKVLRKIPRPPNAFILYRSDKMRELKKNKPHSDMGTGLDKLDYQRKLSSTIGELWRNESEEVKAIFYEKAKQAAREHQERYPEYRFKPASKKASARATNASTVLQTPEKRADTDFSPGDISGPVSGSGSGSGRKRASLDGARSKALPYSASRHRRTSSSGPSSPSVHQHSRTQAQHSEPILLHAASHQIFAHNSRQPVTRSVSYGYPSRHRKEAASARRSLDGHTSQSALATDQFNTLLPHHLRHDSHVFLAPPPVPIGLAITTDEATAPTDGTTLQHSRPKMSLVEAVKRALPPERRALLHASLAKKGFLPTAEIASPSTSGQDGSKTAPTPTHSASDASPPSLVQSESGSSTVSSVADFRSQNVWYSQEAINLTSTQGSWAGSLNSGLVPTLDPANQVSLSILTHADPSSMPQNYSGLSDWSMPDPCWLDYCQSQPSSSQSAVPPPSYSQTSIDGAAAYDIMEQAPVAQQQAEPVSSYSFASVDMAQYPQLSHGVNNTNSAVVALSEPNHLGQVQGHVYSLDGSLIGQALVDGSEPSAISSDQLIQEEARQSRAVEELLMQILSQPVSENDRPVCPLFDYSTAAYPQGGQYQQQSYLQAPPQWQSWQQSFQSTPVVNPNASNGRPQVVPSGPVLYSDEFAYPPPSNLVPQASKQEWNLTEGGGQYGRVASPTPMSNARTNFSRPILYDSQPQDEIDPSLATASQFDGIQIKQEQSSQLDVSGLVTAEPSQLETQTEASRTNKLRNHLASIKKQFARVRHRATPSTSSLSAVRDAGTHVAPEDDAQAAIFSH
ncbi:related to HMG-box protein Hmg3 [Ustilago trichophora]|uniref:Related to HMG-box protein Hmg3 n=1 Tax=Ustilago trichophora TaxID=86804 RepID=A0A5C3E2K0_9BASI|nr:related to HMG-box protein Hmg3 [Ustilago trichophora]